MCEWRPSGSSGYCQAQAVSVGTWDLGGRYAVTWGSGSGSGVSLRGLDTEFQPCTDSTLEFRQWLAREEKGIRPTYSPLHASVL